ncbi:MAG: hypothetical protein LBC62_05075 [Treponema sp.]|jgi:hypothetical protein|nr:hypothetical protein [Treponema sp.]
MDHNPAIPASQEYRRDMAAFEEYEKPQRTYWGDILPVVEITRRIAENMY